MFHVNPGQVKLSARFTTEQVINCFANFPHKMSRKTFNNITMREL